MHLQNSFANSKETDFAQWILDIGNGDVQGLSLAKNVMVIGLKYHQICSLIQLKAYEV